MRASKTLTREHKCIWQHICENKHMIQVESNDLMMLTWRDCTLPLQRAQRRHESSTKTDRRKQCPYVNPDLKIQSPRGADSRTYPSNQSISSPKATCRRLNHHCSLTPTQVQKQSSVRLCLFSCKRFYATGRTRWSRQLIFNTYLALISWAWLVHLHTNWLSFTDWLNNHWLWWNSLKGNKSKRRNPKTWLMAIVSFFLECKINEKDLTWKNT